MVLAFSVEEEMKKCYVCGQKYVVLEAKLVQVEMIGYHTISWKDLYYHEHCVHVTLEHPEHYGHERTDCALYIIDCIKEQEKRDEKERIERTKKMEKYADDWYRLSTRQMVD